MDLERVLRLVFFSISLEDEMPWKFSKQMRKLYHLIKNWLDSLQMLLAQRYSNFWIITMGFTSYIYEKVNWDTKYNNWNTRSNKWRMITQCVLLSLHLLWNSIDFRLINLFPNLKPCKNFHFDLLKWLPTSFTSSNIKRN